MYLTDQVEDVQDAHDTGRRPEHYRPPFQLFIQITKHFHHVGAVIGRNGKDL